MTQANGQRDVDDVIAEARALNDQIEAEGRADTERFIDVAEEANALLDEAATVLADVETDFNSTESDTPPVGAEQVALELANLKKEVGL